MSRVSPASDLLSPVYRLVLVRVTGSDLVTDRVLGLLPDRVHLEYLALVFLHKGCPFSVTFSTPDLRFTRFFFFCVLSPPGIIDDNGVTKLFKFWKDWGISALLLWILKVHPLRKDVYSTRRTLGNVFLRLNP